MRQLRLSCFLSLLVFLLISGCSSRSGDESSAGSTPGPTVNTSAVSLNKDDYPVFPLLMRAPIRQFLPKWAVEDSREKVGKPT